MMPNLEKIYDRDFFREWGAANSAYVQSAFLIADILYSHFQPKRLVDLGCGCGVYAHRFIEHGVSVTAIDGVTPPDDTAFPVPLHIRDLTRPLENTWGTFDIALCLEVAEHIPQQFADVFLDNLTRFSDTIILSAAPPNQGGHHHVNEQPKRYWVNRFAHKGYLYDRKQTGILMEAFKKNKPGFMWMCEHISVYRRNKMENINWAGLPLASNGLKKAPPPAL